MAEMGHIHIKLDVDQEKLDRLTVAIQNADIAMRQVKFSVDEIRNAMYAMENAFVVKKEVE